MFDELKKWVPLIDKEMFSFLPEKQHFNDEFYSLLKDYPNRGGKRLRPFLCLMACRAVGGDPLKALRTAASIEMFQSFALVHDDIEDGSEMRRGKPCLHRIHGVPIAINVGDGLLITAFKMLLENREVLGKDLTIKVMEKMFELYLRTVEGQSLDIYWVQKNVWDLKEVDYFRMVTGKTGYYSGRTPIEIGALIGGADQKTISELGSFGEKIAIAFQIQDDVLNIERGEKDEHGYGKERGGDILEGKRTLMIIHLLNNLPEKKRARVKQVLSKDRSGVSQKEVEEIIGLMEGCGSIDYAKSVSREMVFEAKKKLSILKDAGSRKIFEQIADFLVDRKY